MNEIYNVKLPPITEAEGWESGPYVPMAVDLVELWSHVCVHVCALVVLLVLTFGSACFLFFCF